MERALKIIIILINEKIHSIVTPYPSLNSQRATQRNTIIILEPQLLLLASLVLLKALKALQQVDMEDLNLVALQLSHQGRLLRLKVSSCRWDPQFQDNVPQINLSQEAKKRCLLMRNHLKSFISFPLQDKQLSQDPKVLFPIWSKNQELAIMLIKALEPKVQTQSMQLMRVMLPQMTIQEDHLQLRKQVDDMEI